MAFFHGCKVQNEKTSFRGTLYGKEGNRQRFSVQEKKRLFKVLAIFVYKFAEEFKV